VRPPDLRLERRQIGQCLRRIDVLRRGHRRRKRGRGVVSLQQGDAVRQTMEPPPGMALHDVTDELDDFADTAALVAADDLVIGVDTAIAHLAGTLDQPVWLLTRFDADWRWRSGRTDSPWYPTARRFRQPAPGDWHAVINEVAAALRDFARRG